MNIDEIKKQLSICIIEADKKEQYASIFSLDDAITAAKQMASGLKETAENNGRLRAIETLHPMGEDNISTSKTNVMFNYISRGSWIPPHKHDNSDTFYYILSGKLAFLEFKDNEISSVVILQEGEFYVIERGVFHSDFILADYSYVLSGKNSGFDPVTEKTLLQGDWPKEYIDADGKWATDRQQVKKIHSHWKKIIYEQRCGLLPLDYQKRQKISTIYSYSEIMTGKNETGEPFSIYCSAGGNGVRFFGNNHTIDSKCLQKITVNGHSLSILEISLIYFNYLKKTGDHLPLKNISTITPNAHNKIECSIQNFLDSNKLDIIVLPFKPRLDPVPGSVHIIIDYIVSGRLQCDVVSGAKVVVLHPMEALGMLIEQKIIDFTANGDMSFYFVIRKQEVDRGGALMVSENGKVEVIYDEDIKECLHYKNLFQIYINLDNFLGELSISKSDIADMPRDKLISITEKRILKNMEETHHPFNGYAENEANNAYHIDAITRIFNTGFIELDGEYWNRDCGLKYQYNLPDVEKYAVKYYSSVIQQFFEGNKNE